MELSELKGLGPKRLELLHQLQIESCEDLVRYFPSTYFNDNDLTRVADAKNGETVTLFLRIVGDASVFYNKGKTIVSQRAADESGTVTLRWMNQPYMAGQYGIGTTLYVQGRITRKRGTILYSPRIEHERKGILPIYDLPKGLTQPVFRAAVKTALDSIRIVDSLPEEVCERYALPSLGDALRQIHFPTGTEELYRARYRMQFEQAFFYFLAVASFRESARLQNGFSFRTKGTLQAYCAKLQFRPTDAQMRVLGEVERDLQAASPMNRLVQGDVGSGKTVIAAYALFVSSLAGKQGALLAPTEILAVQHFQKLSALFGNECALYTGSLTAKEKRLVAEQIHSGGVSIIVGTHALLSDNVIFRDLGVVITDEQHRFGVEQRAKMASKGIRPDVLVMSATPIPRTLALLLYSDLALSVIDEMPQGRIPIQTNYVPTEKRISMYRYVAERVVTQNERAFVVCPLIEPSEGFESLSAEEVFSELKNLLQDCPIGLLHGRMKDDEKNAVMEAFRTGRYRVLVSTTVVEVGVDIPEATYMIIEGADRFGLATLHQLRGRVGRNDKPSFCYLLARKPSEHAKERIRMMLQSDDGFDLAQKDMEMRGYGDLFGVRQSGEGAFAQFLSGCTVELLEQANMAAAEVLGSPSLQNNELIRMAAERYTADQHIARN